MILIGQYDSPFVRRVAVTLQLYGIPYEHRPWSVWGNAEQIASYNPLCRVPTLVLEDGVVLVDSSAIIDTLDDVVGPGRALLPRLGPVNRCHVGAPGGRSFFEFDALLAGIRADTRRRGLRLRPAFHSRSSPRPFRRVSLPEAFG